ncbi:PASTA domain-containing protein [Eggerthellaceae bacterium zg-886]|uniref:PASTA domain-containing protein n=2 Tax=Xiamenia xianingshaonis TaxID=2682776 RepID=A0ABX0IGF9_9ACTN|nr:PASTA domain-containing protein [Xiamenia xianingshaonis]
MPPMICPNCQRENRSTAKFCDECGCSLASAGDVRPDEAEPGENAAGRAASDEADARPSDDADAAAGAMAADDPTERAASEEREASAEVSAAEEGAADADEAAEPGGGDAAKTSRLPNDLTPFVPLKSREAAETGPKIDLSGIDECLVDSSYQPPKNAWRTGDTMELPPLEGAQTSRPREFRADNDKPQKRRVSIAAIVFGCLVIALGIGAFATYSLEMWGGKIVPDVVGKTQTDAEYLLGEKSFSVQVNEVPSDETQGIVLSMVPSAGGRVDADMSVVINVSVPRIVPDVVQDQRDVAVTRLQESGITSVVFEAERSSEHPGTVLAVDPKPGVQVSGAEEVTLTLAEPYTVPDVAGMKSEEAVRAIEEAGYVATITYDTKDAEENDVVLSSKPDEGETLDPGSSVELVVSMSRSATLVDITEEFLQDLKDSKEPLHATNNGMSYLIESIDSVSFDHDETTAFEITASDPAATDTNAVSRVKGTITWDPTNYVVSIDVES